MKPACTAFNFFQVWLFFHLKYSDLVLISNNLFSVRLLKDLFVQLYTEFPYKEFQYNLGIARHVRPVMFLSDSWASEELCGGPDEESLFRASCELSRVIRESPERRGSLGTLPPDQKTLPTWRPLMATWQGLVLFPQLTSGHFGPSSLFGYRVNRGPNVFIILRKGGGALSRLLQELMAPPRGADGYLFFKLGRRKTAGINQFRNRTSGFEKDPKERVSITYGSD